MGIFSGYLTTVPCFESCTHIFDGWKKPGLKHRQLELSSHMGDECEEDSEMIIIPSRYLWRCSDRRHTQNKYPVIMLQRIMCNEWVEANISVLF